MTVELGQTQAGLQYETITEPEAPETQQFVADITQGAEISTQTYMPGEIAELQFDAADTGFETADEFQSHLTDVLGPTTEVSVEAQENAAGQTQYNVSLKESTRTMEEYDGGILFTNGAGDAEAGLAKPVTEKESSDQSGQQNSEPVIEAESAATDLPAYMQEWADLQAKAKLELATDPGSQYWQSMLTHVETTLAQMKQNTDTPLVTPADSSSSVPGQDNTYVPPGGDGAESNTPGVNSDTPQTINSQPGDYVSEETWSSQPEGKLSSSEADAIALEVIDRLKSDLGLTTEQAAGIVGNLYYESAGMNPHVNEFASTGGADPYGDPNATIYGYGWAQWSYDRKPEFLSFAAANGLEVGSPEHNYQFLLHELTSTEAGSLSSIMQQDTAVAAAQAFRVDFERAEFPNDGPRLQEASRLALLYGT